MKNIITFFNGSDKESDINNLFLSNFYIHEFEGKTKDGKMHKFICGEQYFMYLKALHFEQFDSADLIMRHDDWKPWQFKKIGRQLPNYDKYGKSWEEKRIKVMTQVEWYKFSQHDLRKRLLNTNDSILIEASPYDKFWGAGMNSNEIHRQDPNHFFLKGQNNLGKILVQVRQVILDKQLNK